MTEVERIEADAITWHLASEGEAFDWDAFTAWLEADPRHRAAYDEVALADALIGDHAAAVFPSEAANDDAPLPARSPVRRWGWAGGGLAAALIALVAIPPLMWDAAVTYTTAAQARTIALNDGSQIVLSPRSTLTIADRGQTRLALAGDAVFDIRHDPSRSLTIAAGPVELRDIGTRFAVQASSGVVRVAVSDGTVEVASEALDQPVSLRAGRKLYYDAKAGSATVEPVATQDVGSWRQHQLTYRAAPLALVAADLARYAGLKLTVPAELAERRFSGTLSIDDGQTALRDLAQLMQLHLVRVAGGYRLSAAGG